MYSSSEEVKADINKLKSLVEDYLKYKGKITSSSDMLLNATDDYFALARILDKLIVYSHMKFDEDKGVSESESLMGIVDKFADEVSGTFNVETGKFERILSEEELAAIEAAKTEDEFAQANADILDELYAGDNSVSELLTESDNTVISEVIDSASTSDENENTANQIDIQVMILTENMAAFLDESNISDCVNMQSGTDNFEFANQLLVGTQVS